jgi:hypothetical protein
MSNDVKMTIVSSCQFLEEDFKDPSTFFTVMATGDRCYYHTRDRVKAQNCCDENWGAGKYKVRTDKTIKPKGELSAKGFLNSKSRSGMRKN